MCEDKKDIQMKTWARTMQSINKLGYSEGVSDGQDGTFQPCFDSGYKVGLEFGLELGYNDVVSSILQKVDIAATAQERLSHVIPCQMCTKGTTSQENIALDNSLLQKNI